MWGDGCAHHPACARPEPLEARGLVEGVDGLQGGVNVSFGTTHVDGAPAQLHLRPSRNQKILWIQGNKIVTGFRESVTCALE